MDDYNPRPLDYIQALKYAQNAPTKSNLGATLANLGVALPAAIAKGKHKAAMKKSLADYLQSGGEGPVPMVENVDEAEKVAKIKALLTGETPEQKLVRTIAGGQGQLLSAEDAARLNRLYPGANIAPGMDRRLLSSLLPKDVYNPLTGETVQTGARTIVRTPPGAKDALSSLKRGELFVHTLENLEKTLNTLPSGRIAGTWAEYTNKYFGTYPAVKTVQADTAVLQPMVARFVGGDVGNLNEQEQVRALQALPRLNGTLEERKQAVAVLKEIANGIIQRNKDAMRFSGGAETEFASSPAKSPVPPQSTEPKIGSVSFRTPRGSKTPVAVKYLGNGKWEKVK